ncbi:hypothetical protein H0H93_009509 [Arthromyces matolae]|nr:hypothetical protein H0H93_009509 [Arthromyces matolae]
MSTATFVAQSIFLLTFIWLIKRFFSKTDLDNIPGPDSTSFVTGNLGQMFNPSLGWEFNSKLALQYGRVSRIYGMFGKKLLAVYDPKALHHILVKDQAIYEETSSFFERLMRVCNTGEQHRRQRKMLNPVFSTAYMRNMVPVFSDIARRIENAIKQKLVNGAQEVDLLHWMGRAALEMIGQSGFGYSFDPLVEGARQHSFCEAAKSFSPALHKMAIEQQFLPILVKIGSPKFRRWFVDHLPIKRLRDLRDIVDSMDRTMVEIFEDKKRVLQEATEDGAALKEKIENPKDLISILIKANMEASEEDKLPDEEVLGQMSYAQPSHSPPPTRHPMHSPALSIS